MKVPLRQHKKLKFNNVQDDQPNALISTTNFLDKQEYQRNKIQPEDTIMRKAELINNSLHKTLNLQKSEPATQDLNFREKINILDNQQQVEQVEYQQEQQERREQDEQVEYDEIDKLKDKIKKIENYVKTKSRMHGYRGVSRNPKTIYDSIKNKLDVEEKLKFQAKLNEYENTIARYKQIIDFSEERIKERNMDYGNALKKLHYSEIKKDDQQINQFKYAMRELEENLSKLKEEINLEDIPNNEQLKESFNNGEIDPSIANKIGRYNSMLQQYEQYKQFIEKSNEIPTLYSQPIDRALNTYGEELPMIDPLVNVLQNKEKTPNKLEYDIETINSSGILKNVETSNEYSQLLKLIHPRNKTSFRPTLNKIIMKIINSNDSGNYNPMQDKFVQMYIKNSRDSIQSSGFFSNMFKKIKGFFNRPLVKKQIPPIQQAIKQTPVLQPPIQKINEINNTVQENIGKYRPRFDRTFELTNDIIRQFRPDLSSKLESYKQKADSYYDTYTPKINDILGKITTGRGISKDTEINEQIKNLSNQFDITNDIFVDPYGGYFDKAYNKILKKVGNTKYYIQTFRKYDTNRLKYSGRVLRKPFKKVESGIYTLDDKDFKTIKSAGIFKSSGILKSRGIEAEDVDLDSMIDEILESDDMEDIKKILITTENEDLIEIIVQMVQMINQAKEALNNKIIDEDEYNTFEEYGYKKFEDDNDEESPVGKLKSSGIITKSGSKIGDFFKRMWNNIKKVGRFILKPFRWANDKIVKPIFNSSLGKALKPLAAAHPLAQAIVGGVEQGSKIVDTVGNVVGNGLTKF